MLKQMVPLGTKTQFVYVLLCSNGTYYTGCTQDLAERMDRHNNGYVDSTKQWLPVQLVFYCAFPDRHRAFAFEKYLKSGSGIAFRNKRLL